jgi:D-glycero-D-manno-heptose 1,7-bisphosphate phosphatase
MEERRRRYVLLEREGVINLRNSNGHAKSGEKFEFLPRALEALRLLALDDYAAIVISRRACGSNGPKSSNGLDAVTRRYLLEVALSEGHIAHVYYCRHGSDENCHCYGLSDGLIALARADYRFVSEETYFVGEEEFGLQAAAAQGCPCIRIQRDAFLQAPMLREEPYWIASNLYEAAEHILAIGRARKGECKTARGVRRKFGFVDILDKKALNIWSTEPP